MNFPRGCTYGNSGNSSNDLYVAGGINGSSANCDTTVTERYNGSTWSMGPSLNANRNMHGMAGSSNAGLVSSGKSGFSIVSTSEELTGTGTSCVINTLSPS